jgi:hypothetical protein
LGSALRLTRDLANTLRPVSSTEFAGDARRMRR